MPVRRTFRKAVRARAIRDPAFRSSLLASGFDALLAGDLPAFRSGLRTYVNATLGFARLAERTGIPEKSLMRMLGPAGNPAPRTWPPSSAPSPSTRASRSPPASPTRSRFGAKPHTANLPAGTPGSERRPPAGIARERETRAGGAKPGQLVVHYRAMNRVTVGSLALCPAPGGHLVLLPRPPQPGRPRRSGRHDPDGGRRLQRRRGPGGPRRPHPGRRVRHGCPGPHRSGHASH